MASAQANAERYAAAVKNVESAMKALSESHGVSVPPPAGKADDDLSKKALEMDRIASFMAQISGISPVPVSFAGEKVPGSIQDGYVDSEANKPDDEPAPKPAKRGKAAASADDDTADTSPLSDEDAAHAIDQIGRMRSKDRLQSVIDADKRKTVQDAAKARLEALGQ